MKRLVLVAIVVAVAAYAASAWSAGSAGPSNARLQQEITALQKQVKTLKKNIDTVDTNAAVALVVSLCGDAMTADALEGTWQVIDQVAGRTIFGPQTAVQSNLSGKDSCSLLQLARSSAVPPTILPLQQLLAGTSAKRYGVLLHTR